ncbi:MAG: efflux RND transporter periplasmic adaptor subunit [Chloroflexota bacterium]
MQRMQKVLGFVIAGLLLLAAPGCQGLALGAQKQAGLSASGVVETVEVTVAPELAGRVAEVYVDEGDAVQAGQALFRLEDRLLEAQRKQAAAAYESAQATQEAAQAALALAQAEQGAAQAGIDLANAQYQLELQAARSQEQPLRAEAWDAEQPNEFKTPPWYFDKDAEIAAARAELESAGQALQTEQANYAKVMQSASNADLKAAEDRLAKAQAAFKIAKDLKDRDYASEEREKLEDFLKTLYDTAKAELDSAQKELNSLLSSQAFDDVVEAKARLAVAQERYRTTLDYLNNLFTGEQSLQLKVAQAGLDQAKAHAAQVEALVAQAQGSLKQAEKTIAQAQAALDLIDVQLELLTVRAAVDGEVMVRNVQPGEVASPGVAVMTLARLDHLTVTVYIPEDRYGQVSLGDSAQVTVDSFPGQAFTASVTRIADRAEYTPRNVQTQEDRRTIVFAIQLTVDDPDGKLKPGMPADVNFSE